MPACRQAGLTGCMVAGLNNIKEDYA